MEKVEFNQIKKISSYSSVTPWLYLPFRLKTIKKAWKLITTVICDFFLLQNLQKLKITKYPVIYVDSPLDEKIPFNPTKVKTYMNFIPYFLRPTVMLIKRMGYKNATPYLNEYLDFIATMYKNAATIYRFCMTTTHRPNYLKGKEFKAIHVADPHLLCVPSLHVTIAAGTYTWFKRFFANNIFNEQEANVYLSELLHDGLKITESVLFVKQHSVNCVPIAFYMLSASMPKEFFTASDVDNFISLLFSDCTELSDKVKSEIKEYFKFMYERNFLENIYADNWQDCIKHWLIDYANETGQGEILKVK